MEISELYTYPVKSLAGISLETAELERTGIRYDRQWMVVEPDGTFMTQREFPQMALIETNIVDGRLQLSTFGMETVTVDEPDIENNERVQTDVWGTGISAIRCEISAILKCKRNFFPNTVETTDAEFPVAPLLNPTPMTRAQILPGAPIATSSTTPDTI